MKSKYYRLQYLPKLILYIVIANIVLFSITLKIRKPWRTNILSSGHHQWLSGSTIKYVNNWYFQNPITLKFALLDNPDSIEFATLRDRKIYSSYPPGTIIPLWIITKITKHKLDPLMLDYYNLFNEFLISIILALSSFILLKRLSISYKYNILFSVSVSALFLFNPSSMYWFQNVFFADQAIILPYVLFIFLEIYDNDRLKFLQLIIAFYGAITDWFFTFIIFAVVLKRILTMRLVVNYQRKIRDTLFLFGSWCLGILLFITQVFLLNGQKYLWGKFLFRTGISKAGKTIMVHFFRKFWLEYMINGYGFWQTIWILLVPLMLVVVIIFRKYFRLKIKTEETNIIYFILMLSIPCFLQTYLLSNHSYIHDFSTLKFVVPIATSIILIPVLIIKKSNIKKFFYYNIIIVLVFLSLLLSSKSFYTRLFVPPTFSYFNFGNFIFNNTSYRDVVFSKNYMIDINPPQIISYSNKRVYRVNNYCQDIYVKVYNINKEFSINILEPVNITINADILNIASKIISNERYKLIKINKDDFMNLIKTKKCLQS